jgi:hypothetical protein
VVTAWSVVDKNSQAYITLATQGLTNTRSTVFSSLTATVPPAYKSSTKTVLLAVDNDASTPSGEPSPSDVKDNFGPPSYVDTLLSELGPEAGKINEALSSFLAIPYVK